LQLGIDRKVETIVVSLAPRRKQGGFFIDNKFVTNSVALI